MSSRSHSFNFVENKRPKTRESTRKIVDRDEPEQELNSALDPTQYNTRLSQTSPSCPFRTVSVRILSHAVNTKQKTLVVMMRLVPIVRHRPVGIVKRQVKVAIFAETERQRRRDRDAEREREREAELLLKQRQ